MAPPNANTEFDAGSDADADVPADSEIADVVGENPLVELLTPASKVRILMALIDLGGHDTNPTDICKKAAISRQAWYDNRDELIGAGVIEQTRKTGSSPMYRAVMDDEIVTRLEDVYDIAAVRQRDRAPDGE